MFRLRNEIGKQRRNTKFLSRYENFDLYGKIFKQLDAPVFGIFCECKEKKRKI